MEREKLIETWLAQSQAAQRVMKSRHHAGVADERLTIGQMGLLFYLSENQPVSSKQVAADTHNSKSAVAQLLEGLDSLRLIIRHTDPSDRRVVYVNLSKAGTDKVKALQDRRRALFLEMAEALDKEELEVLVRAQRKMLDHLRELDGKDKEGKGR
jgi:DNA-binding MarR family transcriptional regulator